MIIHTLVRATLGLVSLLAVPHAVADITSEALGKLLLKSRYSAVTQEYNVYYANGPTSASTYGGWHPGIDYRAASGTTVYSPINGKVASTGTLGRVSIQIDGTNDYFILLHLSRFNVSSGTVVKVGDTLGVSGSVGATAPHLHVELRTNSTSAAYYFKSSSNTGSNKDPRTIPVNSSVTIGSLSVSSSNGSISLFAPVTARNPISQVDMWLSWDATNAVPNSMKRSFQSLTGYSAYWTSNELLQLGCLRNRSYYVNVRVYSSDGKPSVTKSSYIYLN